MSELSINEVVKIVQELKALERKFGEEKGLINLFKKLIQDSSKLDESLKLHSLKIEEIVKYVNSSKNDMQKEIMLITTEGIVIRMKSDSISVIGRNTSGVKLINIDADSDIKVASVAKVRFQEEDESEDMEEDISEVSEETVSDENEAIENETAPEEV